MERLTANLVASVNMCALYPQNHPSLIQAVQHTLASLNEFVEERHRRSITYVLIGDDLLVDDEVIRKTTLPVREFVSLLKGRGIEHVTLAGGLEAEEAQQFIRSLATGERIHSTANVIVGRAHLVMEREPDQTTGHQRLSAGQIEIVREEWARYRVERKLRVDQLEELVWSFIDALGSNTRRMLPLAQVKSHDEYTFVHSVNVSLMVLAQARALGLWGEMLHDFGIAALLHDFGKLSIPHSVLNRPGRLDADEWETMKRHTTIGAWQLSQMENTSPLAVVVAYEHHLRYDGAPNYPLLRAPRIPTLATRMTSIADTYDAMTTVRPYTEVAGRAAALELLKTRSGTFYDPQLVANFIRITNESSS